MRCRCGRHRPTGTRSSARSTAGAARGSERSTRGPAAGLLTEPDGSRPAAGEPGASGRAGDHRFTNTFQAAVAAGAELELRAAGMELLIGSTDDDVAREPELARTMIDRRVSALMMMPDGNDRGYLRPEHTYGIPVVLVGRPANGVDVDVVMIDDDRAVEEATEQLIALGHRRIAALAGRDDSFRASQRLQGFRTAVARGGGSAPQPDLVRTGLITADDARAAMERLMLLREPPTAVLALNLGLSTGVLLDRVAHRRELAFVALDETELSAGLGISAIVRNPRELGRQAARLAINRLTEPDQPAQVVVVPYTIARRGSGELSPVPDRRSA